MASTDRRALHLLRLRLDWERTRKDHQGMVRWNAPRMERGPCPGGPTVSQPASDWCSGTPGGALVDQPLARSRIAPRFGLAVACCATPWHSGLSPFEM